MQINAYAIIHGVCVLHFLTNSLKSGECIYGMAPRMNMSEDQTGVFQLWWFFLSMALMMKSPDDSA